MRSPSPTESAGGQRESGALSRRVGLAGLVVWVLAPVVLIAILLYTASTQSLTPSSTPVWVPVEAANEAVTSPIDVALTWLAPSSLRAPAWSGVVQRIFVAPGDRLKDSSRVARIDGVVRIIVQSEEPFFRSISSGTRGPDVSALNAYLKRAGYADVSGDLATWRTTQGIAALANALGASGQTEFDPAWFIYLPTDGFTVVELNLDPGTAAPNLGTVIAESAPVLLAATIVPFGSFSNPSESDEPAVDLDPADVSRLAMVVPDDQRLVIGATEVQLGDPRSVVTEESLSLIADVVSPRARIVQGNLVRDAQTGDAQVPSAALVPASNGNVCVIVEGRDEPLTVELVTETAGFAIVRGDVEPGDRVQVGASGVQRSCG